MMLALRLACALSLLVLGGCATAPPVKVSGPNSAPCLQVFIDDDARLAAAAIHDAQSTPVAGHPYLRVDRLLAPSRTELGEHDALLAIAQNQYV